LFQGLRRTKAVPKAGDARITITERQREILKLLAEGKSDAEIADILRVQESTVRAHIFHIQQRLGMENRGQIVAYAHNVFLKD